MIKRRGLLSGAGAAAASGAVWVGDALAQRVSTNASSNWASPPPQAVAAGFSSLKFFDDFTSNTITGNGSLDVTAGINWYPGSQGSTVNLTDPTNYHLLTTTCANQISNGNVGGGTNASPVGGLVQITGTASITNQNVLNTVPHVRYQTNFAGAGVFGPYGYFEGYMQAKVGFPSSTFHHVSFWMAQINTYTITSGSWTTELDIMETNQNWSPAVFNCGTVHTWQMPGFTNSGTEILQGTPHNNNQFGGVPNQTWSGTTSTFGLPFTGAVPSGYPLADSNWHTFGLLVAPSTASTNASLSLYIDNVKVGGTIMVGDVPPSVGTVGTGTPPHYSSVFTLGPYFIMMGKDNGTDVCYWDWVRVWGV